MRPATVFVLVVLAAAVLWADDRSIQYDASVDFSRVRTFAIRNASVNIPKPELDNRLFIQGLTTSIRTALVARGLKEASAQPDVMVDVSVGGSDHNEVRRGAPVLVAGTRPGRGQWVSTGPVPDRFVEGTLVIDMENREGALVWRGTYRDEEPSAPTLARKLPEDARNLLSAFPPRK